MHNFFVYGDILEKKAVLERGKKMLFNSAKLENVAFLEMGKNQVWKISKNKNFFVCKPILKFFYTKREGTKSYTCSPILVTAVPLEMTFLEENVSYRWTSHFSRDVGEGMQLDIWQF